MPAEMGHGYYEASRITVRGSRVGEVVSGVTGLTVTQRAQLLSLDTLCRLVPSYHYRVAIDRWIPGRLRRDPDKTGRDVEVRVSALSAEELTFLKAASIVGYRRAQEEIGMMFRSPSYDLLNQIF